jgi:hypothetical protein
VKIKGISPIADHWRTKAEELERSLALKGLQVEAMREAIRQALERLPYRVQWLSDLELQEVRADLSQSLNPKNEEGKK